MSATNAQTSVDRLAVLHCYQLLSRVAPTTYIGSNFSICIFGPGKKCLYLSLVSVGLSVSDYLHGGSENAVMNEEDPGQIAAAIFYSISSTQKGLQVRCVTDYTSSGTGRAAPSRPRRKASRYGVWRTMPLLGRVELLYLVHAERTPGTVCDGLYLFWEG